MDVSTAEAMIRSDDPAEVEQGLGMLRDHAEAELGDVSAWFRYGGALDYSDREAAAMDAYQRVIDLGIDRLEPDDRPRLFVQAGSTLRNLKRLDEARELLESGRRQFPDNRAIVAFLALVEVSAGNDRRAVDLLFGALLAPDEGSINDYRRALTWYAGEIRTSE